MERVGMCLLERVLTDLPRHGDVDIFTVDSKEQTDGPREREERERQRQRQDESELARGNPQILHLEFRLHGVCGLSKRV